LAVAPKESWECRNLGSGKRNPGKKPSSWSCLVKITQLQG